jgi:hypothetical protein
MRTQEFWLRFRLRIRFIESNGTTTPRARKIPKGRIRFDWRSFDKAQLIVRIRRVRIISSLNLRVTILSAEEMKEAR